MITLRQFSIGLLALISLLVGTYLVYEMMPERRARRVAVRLERLLDDSVLYPEMKIREEYYSKRVDELSKELFGVACHCGGPLDGSGPFTKRPFDRPGPHSAPWWRNSGVHKEGCLFSELFKELIDYYGEFVWQLERARRVREESRE